MEVRGGGDGERSGAEGRGGEGRGGEGRENVGIWSRDEKEKQEDAE